MRPSKHSRACVSLVVVLKASPLPAWAVTPMRDLGGCTLRKEDWIGDPSTRTPGDWWVFQGPRGQRVCQHPLSALGTVVPDRANQAVQGYSGSTVRAPSLVSWPQPSSAMGTKPPQWWGSSPNQEWIVLSFPFLSSHCSFWIELVVVLCLPSVYSHLIPFWHMHTAYLFLCGFFSHREYCRT